MQTLRPESAETTLEMIQWALANEQALTVRGAGSKGGIGRVVDTGHGLDLSGLSGVTLYEPGELILAAGAGTQMAEINRLLVENNQQLDFDPPDFSKLLGSDSAGTIGGVLGANLSGPRRIKSGAARDHFLGFHGISGRGEKFKSGGRVMKNVTGFDLPKVMAGSWGTLAVLTDVTVKVLPAPEKTYTVLVSGLDRAGGIAAMTAAIQSSHEVSSAAHLPAAVAAASGVSYVSGAGTAVTAIRVEGFAPSVLARCEALKSLLARFGEVEELHSHNSATLWTEIRDASWFAGTDKAIWRVSVPPTAAAAVSDVCPGEVYFDWAGGLVWMAVDATGDAGAAAIRQAIAGCGGHATLMRGPDGLRGDVPPFEPLTGVAAKITASLKLQFDPKGILNPGRMYE
ncbi:MAG: FAD-binding protein, partial [Rhodospirillales bacterium]